MRRLDLEPPKKDLRYCAMCRKPMPASMTGEVCDNCRDEELFCRVRDYVRSHDVGEQEVADYFEIPLAQVKQWVKDGRISYRNRRL